MADIFTKSHIINLLKSKKVSFFGDSNMRAVYKDFVWRLSNDCFISNASLRKKMEKTFCGDQLVSHGLLTAGRDYHENRRFEKNNVHFEFTFITKCLSEKLVQYCKDIKEKKILPPDVLVINSTLWDLTRWGPKGVDKFKENLPKLMELLKDSLPDETLIIWTTAPPPGTNIKANGLLIKQIEFLKYSIRFEVMEANNYASFVVSGSGFDVLDIHFHLRMQIHRRCEDGIHFFPLAVRLISNLLFTHIALSWGKTLPGNVTNNHLLRKFECLLECGRNVDDGLTNSIWKNLEFHGSTADGKINAVQSSEKRQRFENKMKKLKLENSKINNDVLEGKEQKLPLLPLKLDTAPKNLSTLLKEQISELERIINGLQRSIVPNGLTKSQRKRHARKRKKVAAESNLKGKQNKTIESNQNVNNPIILFDLTDDTEFYSAPCKAAKLEVGCSDFTSDIELNSAPSELDFGYIDFTNDPESDSAPCKVPKLEVGLKDVAKPDIKPKATPNKADMSKKSANLGKKFAYNKRAPIKRPQRKFNYSNRRVKVNENRNFIRPEPFRFPVPTNIGTNQYNFNRDGMVSSPFYHFQGNDQPSYNYPGYFHMQKKTIESDQFVNSSIKFMDSSNDNALCRAPKLEVGFKDLKDVIQPENQPCKTAEAKANIMKKKKKKKRNSKRNKISSELLYHLQRGKENNTKENKDNSRSKKHKHDAMSLAVLSYFQGDRKLSMYPGCSTLF